MAQIILTQGSAPANPGSGATTVYAKVDGLVYSKNSAGTETQLGGSGTPVEILDEGVSLTATVASIDFTGSGVTATNVGNAVTVNIAGGGGSGDVVGPASSTDNAVVRFDGTTGKLIQDSAVTISDTTGDITAGKYNTVVISGSTSPTLAVTGTSSISGSNTGDQTISDATLTTSDITTNNFTTAKHGFVPKGTNVGNFLKDDGTWSSIPGGGDALTSNPLSQFAATTSAQLAGVISDETGSGSLVFATSPTLVTPALGTPSSGTLTNCTFPTLNQNTTGTASNVTGVVASANGGTGVNNGSSTITLGGNLTTSGAFATTITSSATTNATLPAGTNNIGYLEIPQNSQSAAYTMVLADSGKHILHPSADTTARTFTIPANGSVAYPIGTAITIINQNAAGVITIAITTDTMRLAGDGTTGSRTLAANGIATAIKLTSTEWIISGTGLT